MWLLVQRMPTPLLLHGALRACRDAEADKALRDVLRRAGTSSSMDLSDATISRLGAKLASMRRLKVRGTWPAASQLGGAWALC